MMMIMKRGVILIREMKSTSVKNGPTVKVDVAEKKDPDNLQQKSPSSPSVITIGFVTHVCRVVEVEYVFIFDKSMSVWSVMVQVYVVTIRQNDIVLSVVDPCYANISRKKENAHPVVHLVPRWTKIANRSHLFAN